MGDGAAAPMEQEKADSGSSSDGSASNSVGEDEYLDHYDPVGDADDLEELTRQRALALGISVEQVARMRTDAILSCPGCFTTICSFGSQRHVRFRHQYRSVLAENVVVHAGDLLSDPRGGGAETDQYYRVSCEACGTDVGLQDLRDHSYHFYQVLPSEA